MAQLKEAKRLCSSFDKGSVKLTPYLGLLERPGGGYYVFNQTYFSPVKIEGEISKVHEFFKRLQDKGVKHLKSDLRSLLLQNRILVTKEDKSKPADKWTRSKWEKAWKQASFTITFGEEVEPEVLLGNFKTWLEHFDYLFCRDRVNILTIRNVALHSPVSGILLKFDEIFNTLQISKFPFKVTRVIDAPLDWFRMHMSEFSRIESPHVHFSSDIRNKLKSEDLKALGALLNEGFCPHLTLWISDLKAAEKTFSQLVNGLGKDGFTYDFKLEKDVINTQPIVKIADFVYHCHCHKELLSRQSHIYTEILNRIQMNGISNLFIDGQSMGRKFVLDNQKHVKPVADLQGCGQLSFVAALKKNIFGDCEYSRRKCKSCPVRYFCGGISDICLPEISCTIRKGLIHKFLEDATARPKVTQKIEFVSADGTIRIRKAG
jgi:hypothetical protein